MGILRVDSYNAIVKNDSIALYADDLGQLSNRPDQ
jgi:hypothetical protein